MSVGVVWGGMVEHMRCVSGCGVGRDGGAYEVCQWVWCGEG